MALEKRITVWALLNLLMFFPYPHRNRSSSTGTLYFFFSAFCGPGPVFNELHIETYVILTTALKVRSVYLLKVI